MLREQTSDNGPPNLDTHVVDWRKTLSIVVGELLLQEVLAARPFIKGRLLDVGCGKRPYAAVYQQLVDASVGTEVAFSPHGTASADVICRAEVLPFLSASFDTILCTEVLEHTLQPFEALREFERVLKPGGHLLISVPFIYPIHEAPHDYWRFTTYGIDAICRSAGLIPVRLHAKGGTATSLFVVLLHVMVWALNFLSKFARRKRPLTDVVAVRWSLDRLQRMWLRISRWLKSETNRGRSCPKMTAGMFLVAVKPSPAEPRTHTTSGSESVTAS